MNGVKVYFPNIGTIFLTKKNKYDVMGPSSDMYLLSLSKISKMNLEKIMEKNSTKIQK